MSTAGSRGGGRRSTEAGGARCALGRIGALALIPLLVGVAVASGDIPNSQNGEVHLCYDKNRARDDKGGAPLQILDDERNRKGCEGRSDESLVIAQQGTQGQQGLIGPPGPQGPEGPKGDPGPAVSSVKVRTRTQEVTLPAGGVEFLASPCNDGEVATGGGGETNHSHFDLRTSTFSTAQDDTPGGWRVSFRNVLGQQTTGEITAVAVCVAIS